MKAIYPIVSLCMLIAFAYCKRDSGKRTATAEPPTPAEAPVAAPPTEPSTAPASSANSTASVPSQTAQPTEKQEPVPAAKPAVAPKAQAEGTRIYYNGLETYMKGQFSGNAPKEFLLRVRKDQTLHISLQPADAGFTFTVLDEQGAQIGNRGKNWEWLTTFAGDLRIKVYPDTAGGNSNFTLRVAPY